MMIFEWIIMDFTTKLNSLKQQMAFDVAMQLLKKDILTKPYHFSNLDSFFHLKTQKLNKYVRV